MHNVLKLVKKIFTVGVVLTTMTWSIGLAAFLMPLAAHAAVPVAGDLIKASTAAVYYLGSDGKRYVFPNEKTYKTWYANFSGVTTITDAALATYPIGGNVTYKPGVKMVKITTDPKVYAVGAGGSLRWITGEAVASAIYGASWAQSVEDVSDAFFVNYTTGVNVAAATDFVPATVTAAAASINADKGLGAVVVIPPVGGSGLTVALAADTPAAQSVVVVVSTTQQSSALIPMLSLNFSASSDGAVKVTSLALKKTGISADADVRNVYLYDDSMTRLAEYQSFTSSVVTFSSAAGLFDVPAGTTKKIWVRADYSNGATSGVSGKQFGFSLLSAAGVTTNGAAVSGAFPLAGAIMTTAAVTDSAQVLLPTPSASVPTSPATVDPGQIAREVWRTTLAVSNQKVELRKIKFLVNGSVTQSDLQNFKLSDAGVQLGATAQVASDMTVTFDLTAAPYVIAAGITKTLSLTCDIVGGTDRSFKMSIQKYSDILVWDTQYGNYVAVDTGSGGSFSVFEKTTSIGINTGTVVMGLATDSPSGSIAAGTTNVDLAKFTIKASGEAVKFSDVYVYVVTTEADPDGLDNVKLLLDGVQVGQTQDLTEVTAKTYSVNFVVPAGTTSVLTVRGDVKTKDAVNLTATKTVKITLRDSGNTISGLAKGQVSLASATGLGVVAGQTLTVRTGTLVVSKNASFSDRSATVPTGVVNATNVKVGSFVITSGAGEASDVSQIILTDSTSDKPMGEDFQNLKLMHGATQIGTTIGSLNTTATTYTFTPSSAIRLAASEQYVVDVYADILSTSTNAAADAAFVALEVTTVSATGIQTSTATSVTYGAAVVRLQNVYLSTSGSLIITAAAETPTYDQLVLGSTGNVVSKFRFAAGASEDITITKIILSDRNKADGAKLGNLASTGTPKNISLWDGATQVGSTVSTLSDTSNTVTPYATFQNLTWTVPKNSAKVLTVKTDLSTFDDGGVSSSTLRFSIPLDWDLSTTGNQEPIEARGAASGVAITGAALDLSADSDATADGEYFDNLKTKLTIAYAADAPSGLSSASAEQTVAKFTVSNAANSGNYVALVKKMNFSVASSGASLSAASTLNVYKDSVSTANLLVTTSYGYTNTYWALANEGFSDTQLGNLTTSLYVAAGSSATVIVTLKTSIAGFTANETLSVGIATGDWTWDDDAYDSVTTLNGANTMIMSLPLAGKTLYY